MAYTEPTVPWIIKEAWVPFKVLLAGTASVGEPLYFSDSSDGAVRADADDKPCNCFAMEDGVSGDTINACMACLVEAQGSVATGGIYSRTAVAASTDYGLALYISATAGEYSTSAGTIGQQVGWILGAYEVMLVASQYLTGTNISASGNLSVTGNSTLTGTLAVTSTTTLTGALAANGGITVASGKNLTFTKGEVIGYVGTASDDATLTCGGTILVDTSSKDVNITLPTAAAGLCVKAVCTSATKQLTVTANTSDKVINASGAAKDSVKGSAAAYNNITLFAVDATNWVTLGYQGTWTYS